jgi:N-terminal region of glycosyl transferase group 7/N-terminal domain of galactosyltransferase
VARSEGGAWTLSGDILTLQWNGCAAEEYRNVGGEFILGSVPLPALPPSAATSHVIRTAVVAHPDRAAWLAAPRSGPTLGIVIPYRDREEQLAALLPHLVAFFARDLRNSHIRPLIVISEQADAQPFNRGWCCNAGFLAVADDCDYVCFHDVDYMPLWADYGYSPFPTRVIWYGADLRPMRVSADNQQWLPATRDALKSVVVLDKALFVAANGFSNQYRGWGFEDADFAARLQALDVPTTHGRDGTFSPLDHDHAGFTPDGQKNDVWQRNETLYERLRQEYQATRSFPEGLGTLPLDTVSVRFEIWYGNDETEFLTVCRLSVSQPES